MDLVVTRLVIEWLGLDKGLRRPIPGFPGGPHPGSGGKVDLVVNSIVLELPRRDQGPWSPILGLPGGLLGKGAAAKNPNQVFVRCCPKSE